MFFTISQALLSRLEAFTMDNPPEGGAVGMEHDAGLANLLAAAAVPAVVNPAPVDPVLVQLAQMQAEIESLRQQTTSKAPQPMKPITMPEKLTKDVNFAEWLQTFISMISLLLPLASDQWLPFLLPNLPPQWQISRASGYARHREPGFALRYGS